jgi:hypothetical protein
MNARTVPLCRRALLQYAIGVAGGVAISYAQPTPAAAGPKISKRAVAYQDHPMATSSAKSARNFNRRTPVRWSTVQLAPRDHAASSCRSGTHEADIPME